MIGKKVGDLGPPLHREASTLPFKIPERLAIPNFENEDPSGQEQGDAVGEG